MSPTSFSARVTHRAVEAAATSRIRIIGSSKTTSRSTARSKPPHDAIIIAHGMVNFRERYCWLAFSEGSQRKTAFTRGAGADRMAA